MSNDLQSVSTAAERAAVARSELIATLRAARTAGASLRQLAAAANLSPETVRTMTRD